MKKHRWFLPTWVILAAATPLVIYVIWTDSNVAEWIASFSFLAAVVLAFKRWKEGDRQDGLSLSWGATSETSQTDQGRK